MNNTLNLSLDVDRTVELICDRVQNGSMTAELIDRYEIESIDSKKCIVLIFDKHYYRAGNRLTLTVVIDELENFTRVHYKGGGGGQGLFKFDWGASDNFENIVDKTLSPYRL